MKRQIAIITGIFMMMGACNAATVCRHNSTYIASVDKAESGTTTSHDNADKVWRVDFPSKTVTGNAACNEISGTYARPTTNLYTTSVDVGTYCWCQMWPVAKYGRTTGLSSYWVYLKNYTSADGCASGCAADCATAMSTNLTFRSGVYESIW